ncbi:hypothetical protein ACJJIK_07025 [Microbulbifer sp. ZKSA006]
MLVAHGSQVAIAEQNSSYAYNEAGNIEVTDDSSGDVTGATLVE